MELDWNNNGDAIDAMRQDAGIESPPTPEIGPVNTVSVLERRLAALEHRIEKLEEPKDET
jgi:hypothetical protein